MSARYYCVCMFLHASAYEYTTRSPKLVFKLLFWWYIIEKWIGPRHQTFYQDALRKLMECNQHKSNNKLALELNTSQSTICHHLEKIGKVWKLGVWVPYTLRIRSRIHSNKSSFKIEKWLVSQECYYRWWKKKKTGLFMMAFNAKGSGFDKAESS